MAYNDLISRGDAQSLMPEEVSREIIQGAVKQSAALRLFPHIPMSRKQQRLPILSALPMAYFVNGDTGLKQTTKQAWSNKFLNSEPIAVIVPVPEEVLDDAEFDIFGEMRPRIEEAVGRALDAAIFFGVNAPATWPTALATQAIARGHTRTLGTATQANGGIAEDFNQAMISVETDGFDVTGVLARTGIKGRLRGARDTTGQQLIDTSKGLMYDINLDYAMNGLWPKPSSGTVSPATPTSGVDALVGDFSQGLLGVRQDLTWKILTEAPITDNTGAIVINLAQQDAVAMRVVARFAFEVANPITYDNQNAATRFPFAALTTPGT